MIRIRAGAVLKVIDAFTGRPPAPSALRFVLNGAPCAPVAKEGGYYVFTNLPAGDFELVIRGGPYAEELVPLSLSGRADLTERVVAMKPGPAYPFGAAVTRLRLTLHKGKKPAVRQRILLAACHSPSELRIAQDGLQAGDTEMRLFFRDAARAVSLPRDFLLLDGDRSEALILFQLAETVGPLTPPLAHPHKRGCCLYPALPYLTGEDGAVEAVFREPVTVAVFLPDAARLEQLSLSAGENRYSITL